MCIAARTIAWGAISLALVVGAIPHMAVAEDHPTDISPASNVDEDLFMIRAVADLYNQMPQQMFDGKQAVDWCERSRVQVKYLRSTAVNRGLDGGIVAMCDDMTALIDEYEGSLSTLGEIDRKAVTDAIENAVHAYIVGSIKSLQDTNDAAERGETQGQRTITSARSFVEGSVKDYIKQSNESRSQNNQSAGAEQQRFFAIYQYAMKRNGDIARSLTASHGWDAREAGFDADPERAPAGRRPRDPFAKRLLAREKYQGVTEPADLLRRANLCLDAARLVPGDRAYQPYRIDCMADASYFACEAAGYELRRGYADAPSEHAQFAIDVTRAWMAIDPQDLGDFAHVELARALADAGRFDEASDVAAPLVQTRWAENTDFSIRYARLMGIKGNADLCETWLRWSFKHGLDNVNWVRTAADFETLRTQKPAAWQDLLTPKASVWVNFGMLNDDVYLLNQSAFPMTNVKLTATVISKGQVWRINKTAAFVGPGKVFSFDNALSVPGSHVDTIRWSLTSDQANVAGEK